MTSGRMGWVGNVGLKDKRRWTRYKSKDRYMSSAMMDLGDTGLARSMHGPRIAPDHHGPRGTIKKWGIFYLRTSTLWK